MDNVAINRILQRYGFTQGKLLGVEKGYRNEARAVQLEDGRVLNLMLYKNEPGIVRTIKNANDVSDFLAERGFPSRRTVDARTLRLQAGGWRKYAALYNYLHGQTIPWEAYTMNHLKLLGKAMSDMHAALRDFDVANLPDVVDMYLEIFGCMQRYFAGSGVRTALAKKLHLILPKLDQCVAVLNACKGLPNQQALHMDFVRSNILFSGEPTITGILDFEKTARGNQLFDIARTLAFLLVDCKYKSPDKVRKYFLRSGYKKRGAADLQHLTIKTREGTVDVLEVLVDLFLLYDFYKFLRHNPYETLPLNEHFTRTSELLLRRRLIGVHNAPNVLP
jgi:Ser/Thr protein kinase RdoA (MazF antagonist)